MNKIRCLLYCLLAVSLSQVYGQELGLQYNKFEAEVEKRVNFIAIPLIFYLPETNLGFGAASNLSLHWKNQDLDERPTQFTIGGAYTLNKQLLSYVSYQIYTIKETFWFRGELGYYDYVYPFFGIGQNIAVESSNFFSKYPRFRIDAMHQVIPDVFIGLSYRFDDYDITSIDNDQNVFDGVDISDGITSGIGFAAVVDTRNIINYPSEGMLFDLVYHINDDITGATFDYSALQVSFSKYLSVGGHVLALNYNSVNIFGDAPLYELALFGGGKRSRGYIEGEYRANNSFAIQAEYRIRFKNKLKRFGAVFFASAGQIFDDLDEIGTRNTHPAIGTGLRFLLSPEQNLNLRLDTGIGRNGLQFYLTFAEAF